jgi:hypothetical protein
MLEPLSIVSSISFGLGVISFLSNSVSTLKRQESEIRECKLRLEAYSYQLKDRQRDMLVWRYIWYGERGFSNETYEYCWGTHGYREIKSRLEAINLLIVVIGDRLGLQGAGKQFGMLSGEEQEDWTDLVRQIENKPWQHPKAKNFVGKIAFTVSTNSRLQEELGRLKVLMEGLCSTSRLLFKLRQGHEIDKSPTHEELQLLDKTRALSNGLSKFANDLFSFHSGNLSGQEWDLELRLPDPDGDATQTDEPASISIDFLVQCKCLCNFWTAQRFRILYYTEYSTKHNDAPSQIGQEILDQLRDCKKTQHFSSEQKQFEILEAPRSQGPPTRSLLGTCNPNALQRRALEPEMLAMAVSLVNWAFLLWNTSWMPTPCTCRLRRTKLINSSVTYVLRSCLGAHIEPKCFQVGAERYKLLALGCVLAELALGVPISIEERDDGQVAFIRNNQTSNKEELLQAIRRVLGNIGISQSIRYCFSKEHPDIYTKVEQLQEHAENILKP